MKPYFYIAVSLVFSVSALPGTAGDCQGLSDERKTALTKYVQAKYRVPRNAPVGVTEETSLTGCYRKLKFAATAPSSTFKISLFLSPDQQYLSTDLLDTQSNPVAEDNKINLATQADLLKGRFVSIGPVDAPVTIVEFSDFQCPYCRGAKSILKEFMDSGEGKGVRLVFRNFPLDMHPWAKAAAEGAVCAGLQNSAAFWKVHDALFDAQASVTPQNIQAKLIEVVKAVPGVDLNDYGKCVEDSLSLGLVMKDVELGLANQVRGTPTLFINGKRTPGVRSVAELRDLVNEALADAHATGAATH